jgi:NADPH-dependent 2,4-dienoyl-CoA reductase/sulfur reductase-like enzyme
VDRILNKYLDKDFTPIAEEALTESGIHLALNQTVLRFEGVDGKVREVVTTKGTYPADMVVMCIGFKPNTGLFQGKIDILDNGAIKVDEYMRTSADDVYAAGDCCSVIFNPTGEHVYIPSATNAIRMGALVARNILSPSIRYLGTQGTSGLKIYDYNIATTGITEEFALQKGLDVDISLVRDSYRPEFMPSHEEVTIKLVYLKDSRRLVGAQILSKADLTQSMNTLSICIQNKMSLDELAFADFFFHPHYNKPWNYLNTVALNATL